MFITITVGLTPEPHLDTWEEHEHLMNPMFLQSPDEIDLPPLDPELLDHQRRRQVGGGKRPKYTLHQIHSGLMGRKPN